MLFYFWEYKGLVLPIMDIILDNPIGRFEKVLNAISQYKNTLGWLNPITCTIIYVFLISLLTILVRVSKAGTEKVCDILLDKYYSKIASKNLQRIHDQDIKIQKQQEYCNLFSNLVNSNFDHHDTITKILKKFVTKGSGVNYNLLNIESSKRDIEYIFNYAKVMRDHVSGVVTDQTEKNKPKDDFPTGGTAL